MPVNQRKFGAGWVEFQLKHRSLADSGGLLYENVNLDPPYANDMPCKFFFNFEIDLKIKSISKDFN